jgi:hypothetical protein
LPLIHSFHPSIHSSISTSTPPSLNPSIHPSIILKGVPAAVATGCLSDALRAHRRLLVFATAGLAFLSTFAVSQLPEAEEPGGGAATFGPLLALRAITGGASGAAITAGTASGHICAKRLIAML